MKLNKSIIALGVACALGTMATANAALLTSSDATFGSFDSSSGTRSLAIGGFGTITNVAINLIFAKCDDPSLGSSLPAIGTPCSGSGTPFNNEVVFRLTHGATTVNLINANTWSLGGTGTGVVSMTFDMGGAALPGAPSTGTFLPVGNLNNFNGAEANGGWTLFIQDTVGQDRLDYWRSTLTVTTADSVPEPASLALLGLGLAGLGFARRKKA